MARFWLIPASLFLAIKVLNSTVKSFEDGFYLEPSYFFKQPDGFENGDGIRL